MKTNLFVTTCLIFFSSCLQVNYQDWDDNEPNNHNNAESCAELQIYKLGRGGSWNDAQCERPNGWLCQIRAGKAYLFGCMGFKENHIILLRVERVRLLFFL